MTLDATREAFGADSFIEFLFNPELRADPYPFFALLRQEAPVFKIVDGVWVVSSHDLVAEVLRDDRYSSDERLSSMVDPDTEFGVTPFGRVFHNMLLFRDDPDHKRLRDLVQKAFTRKVVENLRPRTEAVVETLLDRLGAEFDLMADFAYPLPVTVICELLGVPASDWERIEDLSRDFVLRFEIQPLRTPEQETRGDEATIALTAYFDELLEQRKQQPADDLVTSLALVEDDGDKLTHEEVVATCLLLLFAGHETTANLIGNGTNALLRNREQWDRLVADPSLVKHAVEELLRFDSPVQIAQRIALEHIEIGGERIKKGETVAVLVAAANHDPACYTDPERLDIARDEAPITSFGAGIHFCLGAPLARMEAQIAFAALSRRFPDLRLVDEAPPTWRNFFVIRGLEELRVRTGGTA